MKSNAAPVLGPAPGVLRDRVGAQVRAIRLARGLSLADASKRTGMDRSTLSKIENGKRALNFEKLLVLSHGLEVDISQLLGGGVGAATPSTSKGRRAFNPNGVGETIMNSYYSDTYLATDLVQKSMSPILCEARARTSEEAGSWLHHSGEEFLYVLNGTLEFQSEIYSPLRMSSGDSLYFDSSVGHRYLSVSDEVCRFLCVCVEPGPSIGQAATGPAGQMAAKKNTPSE